MTDEEFNRLEQKLKTVPHTTGEIPMPVGCRCYFSVFLPHYGWKRFSGKIISTNGGVTIVMYQGTRYELEDDEAHFSWIAVDHRDYPQEEACEWRDWYDERRRRKVKWDRSELTNPSSTFTKDQLTPELYETRLSHLPNNLRQAYLTIKSFQQVWRGYAAGLYTKEQALVHGVQVLSEHIHELRTLIGSKEPDKDQPLIDTDKYLYISPVANEFRRINKEITKSWKIK